MYKPLFFAAFAGLGLTLFSVGHGQDVPVKPLPPGFSYDSGGSGSGSGSSSPTTSVPGYPDCFVSVPDWIGDGWCDDSTGSYAGSSSVTGQYNTEACGWDGGDCCECDCEDGEQECGVVGYACKDPYSTCGPCATDDGKNTVGDGICDPGNYLNDQCLEDGGDCADQQCPSEWIKGYEAENANGKACCPIGCGQCGGSGCGSAGSAFGLGSEDCCINGVLNNQKACVETLEAPCYVDDDLCDPNPCGDNSVCTVMDNSDFLYALCWCEDGYENIHANPSSPTSDIPGNDFECVPIVDDTKCSNGIEGIDGENDNGKACCPVDCGQCGGGGCGSAGATAGLGNKECCINGVLNNQKSCSLTGEAPCKYDEDLPTCSNGVVGYEGSNDSGVACCPLGCTKCGGSGCGTIGSAAGLTNKDCCINGVLNNQPTCDGDGEAPCVV